MAWLEKSVSIAAVRRTIARPYARTYLKDFILLWMSLLLCIVSTIRFDSNSVTIFIYQGRPPWSTPAEHSSHYWRTQGAWEKLLLLHYSTGPPPLHSVSSVGAQNQAGPLWRYCHAQAGWIWKTTNERQRHSQGWKCPPSKQRWGS